MFTKCLFLHESKDRQREEGILTGALKKEEEEEENVERNCCLGEEGCLKSDLSLPLLSPPFSCQGGEAER